MIWYYLSETLLYLCFSLLMGTFLIQLVPARLKPEVTVPKRILQLAILGVIFFSLAPIIRLVLFLYEDIGLALTIQNVVSGFEVGKAWTVTILVSFFFYLYVSLVPVLKKKIFAGIGLLFTLVLLLALGWSSHAASLTEGSGFVFHSLHFLAVIIWVGLLLIVGWFSKNQENWIRFLNWFTPVAITCFVIIVGSGIFIMTLVIDLNEYRNAWTVPYGQALLVKHLTIVPVLFFAFINGFWIKRKMQKQNGINPLPYFRAESLFLLFTFAATAVLGQQEPPHSIEITLKSIGPSPIFDFFYAGNIDPAGSLAFNSNFISASFFGLTIVLIGLLLYSFYKKTPVSVPFFMGLLTILALYMGFMTSL